MTLIKYSFINLVFHFNISSLCPKHAQSICLYLNRYETKASITTPTNAINTKTANYPSFSQRNFILGKIASTFLIISKTTRCIPDSNNHNHLLRFINTINNCKILYKNLTVSPISKSPCSSDRPTIRHFIQT